MVIFPFIVLFGKALYVHVRQDCRCPVSLHIEPAAYIQIPPASQQSALILIDRLVSTVEEDKEASEIKTTNISEASIPANFF